MEFGIAKTLLDVSFALQKNEGESDSQLEYARVLGCLMYIMNCTQPDIVCAISKLSRYTSNPNKTHWIAMKRVLGYLKYTQDYALHYNKYSAVLEGYSDANWITGSNEVKSTSEYVFTIGGGAVSWKSSKQTCIARSTMKSEFIALDKRHNTVRELLSSGIITVDYVKSKDNVSDPLTKGLSREGVERTFKGIGLRSRTSQHGVSFEEQLDALERAVDAGRIRYIGLSNETPYDIMKFQQVAKSRAGNLQIVAVQNAYNLLRRNFDLAMAECRHNEW
ncbi:hypothetical protein CQW23_22168 [Capsicum baccatum]|uniref:NADP-dependent oxidoreductase domain-containing protein n=1 Tax=Capsicum baccatum TaxID=33114 RepID=A0A2G2W044_CAPBA|nr:hypothetical protein CQW23_22168 [Capsicum baccatum]